MIKKMMMIGLLALPLNVNAAENFSQRGETDRSIHPIANGKSQNSILLSEKQPISDQEKISYKPLDDSIPLSWSEWRIRNNLAFQLSCDFYHMGVRQYSMPVIMTSITPNAIFQDVAKGNYVLIMDSSNNVKEVKHKDYINDREYKLIDETKK